MPGIVKFAREGVGRVILLIDRLTRPSQIKRTPEQQAAAQAQAQHLSLYQHKLCPFCIKTRRALHRLHISIETKELNDDQAYRDELLNGGGRIQVPCLRIEEEGAVRWMYESGDIIRHLETRFA